MLVRTFALLAALGTSVATAGALLLPIPAARGSGPVTIQPPGTSPSGTTDAHFLDGSTLLLDGRLGHASLERDTRGGTASTFLLATVTGAEPLSDNRPTPPPSTWPSSWTGRAPWRGRR